MCELTDDLGLSPEFLADEDIARDEDEYGREAKCGGPEWIDGYNVGCSGCRHCNPPDRECKPYGFGIEAFEDPGLKLANEAERRESEWHGWGMYTSAFVSDNWCSRGCLISPPFNRELRNFLWKCWSKHDTRLWRRSERVWNRLCDTCDTHTEAVEKYKQWAAKYAN